MILMILNDHFLAVLTGNVLTASFGDHLTLRSRNLKILFVCFKNISTIPIPDDTPALVCWNIAPSEPEMFVKPSPISSIIRLYSQPDDTLVVEPFCRTLEG